MGKTIDITKINLSAKGLAILVVGIIIFIAIWKIAEWGFAKIGGGATAIKSPFKTV